ncbi:hypothetical protein A6B43_00285 [Vespertiliibacter pulmonis]|uniref:Terminase small subunit n=1 Tax=Vespertiliibacter pulmonis TaxID=1443036 RepID=A0A3N4W125_9PAST|nr:hypothetical protein [Vespertiliibacter pulmonis]QLB20084.1 hypothetical protein A6B43_00285 [Vespertiliibacter pulmonis]RPE86049.1 hypothetical protein EDC46_0440 [Vespertiliibacter pulmonis]
MAKKSYDWVAIKVQFINSSLTISEFSEKYSIPFGTLKKQVAQGSWLDERSQVGTETVRKSVEVSSDIRAYQLTELDNKTLALIGKAQDKLARMIEQSAEAKELKSISSAIVDLQKGYRLALGASTENQSKQDVSEFADWVKEISRE